MTIRKNVPALLTIAATLVTSTMAADAAAAQSDSEPRIELRQHQIFEHCPDLSSFLSLAGNWRLEAEFLNLAGETVRRDTARAMVERALGGAGLAMTEWHPFPTSADAVFVNSIILSSRCDGSGVVGVSNNSLMNRKLWDGQSISDGYLFTQTGELFAENVDRNEIRFVITGSDTFRREMTQCAGDRCAMTFRVTYIRED
jgi:hypothetical protein